MGVLATFLKALNLSEQWKLPHIVALQDSGCDNFSWNHLSSAGYGLWNQHLIHADMTMEDGTTRHSSPGCGHVAFLVHNSIETDSWLVKEVAGSGGLAATLTLKLASGSVIRIHNVYNRRNLLDVSKTLGSCNRGSDTLLGDLNLHHPRWGGPGVKAEPGARDLVALVQERGMVCVNHIGKLRQLFVFSPLPLFLAQARPVV